MLAAIRRTRAVSHPAPDTLLLHLLGRTDAGASRHVDQCATCRSELERLRDAAGIVRDGRLVEAPSPTADCLDDSAIGDFIEGRLQSAARASAVDHLLACAYCRLEAKAVAALLADADVVRETSRMHAGRSWLRLALPVGAAAAAVALFFAVRPRDAAPPRLREAPLTSVVAPTPVSPARTVARADTFVWTAVPRAQRYRLRLHDAQGAVLWRAETTDTALVLPDSVHLAAGASYYWKVEASTDWRRWTSSPLTEFRTTRARP